MANKCPSCMGTGKLMGGGMITINCHNCGGSGTMMRTLDKLKDSKSYKESVKNMKKHSNLTTKQAEDMLNEEISKRDIK